MLTRVPLRIVNNGAESLLVCRTKMRTSHKEIIIICSGLWHSCALFPIAIFANFREVGPQLPSLASKCERLGGAESG